MCCVCSLDEKERRQLKANELILNGRLQDGVSALYGREVLDTLSSGLKILFGKNCP